MYVDRIDLNSKRYIRNKICLIIHKCRKPLGWKINYVIDITLNELIQMKSWKWHLENRDGSLCHEIKSRSMNVNHLFQVPLSMATTEMHLIYWNWEHLEKINKFIGSILDSGLLRIWNICMERTEQLYSFYVREYKM